MTRIAAHSFCLALMIICAAHSNEQNSLVSSNPNIKLTPEQVEGAKKISAEQLISLAETLPDLIIIDARIKKDRSHGYLEGSISLTNTDTDCSSLTNVVGKIDRPTVYYCNGPKCGRSYASIQIAVKCGYNNLYWYRGGFEDWKSKDYPFVVSEN